MAEILLSAAEKTFIIHGVQDNIRVDGRGCEDYRFMELETDLNPHCSGSARLRLANTDVIVGVKAELGEPHLERPNEGRLEFFVDCSANATPEFEGRGGETLANSLSSTLALAYNNQHCMDLTKLCIIPHKKCWVLYIDILLLECGGNLFDAASLAAKAALFNTRIPNLTVTTSEQSNVELEVSDDPFDSFRMDIKNAPCLVTLNKIGQCQVVDATTEEEMCTMSRLVMGVTQDGTITALKKDGSSSLHPESIYEMMEIGKRVGQTLNTKLSEALEKEESKGIDVTQRILQNSGFLR